MRKQHFLRWLSGIWAVCLAVTGLPVLHVQGEALSVSAESCILMEAVTGDRKSTRLNSSHITRSRMPSSA